MRSQHFEMPCGKALTNMAAVLSFGTSSSFTFVEKTTASQENSQDANTALTELDKGMESASSVPSSLISNKSSIYTLRSCKR